MNKSAEMIAVDPGLHFLQREGEMRRRIREFNWAATSVGDPAGWDDSFKKAVALMLDCAGPAYIAWGPDFIQLYNDAYVPILGERKHPQALGAGTDETWHEIWDMVSSLFQEIIETGRSVSMANKLMLMQRNGYVEECYFSFSYTPLTNDAGQVVGVLAMPWETTLEFVSYRRANAVRTLAHGLSESQDMRGIYAAFEASILECPQDLPFGLWYELREDDSGLDLVAAAGIRRGSAISPEFLDPSRDGFYKGLIDVNQPALASRSFDTALLQDAWQGTATVPPQFLKIKPLCYTSHQRPNGYIVLAVNPLRPNDQSQQDFLKTVRLHLENAVRRISRAELERREQEHQFQSVMAVLPCLVWMSDAKGACTFVNQTMAEFVGLSPTDLMGRQWSAIIYPDDFDDVSSASTLCTHNTLTLEYRIRHASGEYRWVLDKMTPRYDINGEFLGKIGTCIDITERKNVEGRMLASQAELRNLYDRLQTIRKEERCALAREVHDQLGQLLSAAKIDIDLLKEHTHPAKALLSWKKIADQLQSAGGTIDRALQVVKCLATELRPPELSSQGLPAAIQWHARDFERRTRIRCVVTLDDDMPDPGEGSAVALFGIFQEAMTNVLRHANASRVWVHLEWRGDWVLLRVRDNGVGIARVRGGTRSNGLRGMRERALLAGGRLVVGPLKPSGTLVAVRVPLNLERRSARRTAMADAVADAASYAQDPA